MKNKTKTVIRFEAWQRTIVTSVKRARNVECGFCRRETTVFSPDAFARLVGQTPRQVYRGIESGAFHFIEDADGRLLICENSTTYQLNQLKENKNENDK